MILVVGPVFASAQSRHVLVIFVVVELIFVHLQVKSVGRIYHPILCC